MTVLLFEMGMVLMTDHDDRVRDGVMRGVLMAIDRVWWSHRVDQQGPRAGAVRRRPRQQDWGGEWSSATHIPHKSSTHTMLQSACLFPMAQA